MGDWGLQNKSWKLWISWLPQAESRASIIEIIHKEIVMRRKKETFTWLSGRSGVGALHPQYSREGSRIEVESAAATRNIKHLIAQSFFFSFTAEMPSTLPELFRLQFFICLRIISLEFTVIRIYGCF